MKTLPHFLFLALIAVPYLHGADEIIATRLQVNYLDAPIGLDSSQAPAGPDIMVQDVTERVQSMVKNGQATIPVHTPVVVADGTDPAPGKVKTLSIDYTLVGAQGTAGDFPFNLLALEALVL